MNHCTDKLAHKDAVAGRFSFSSLREMNEARDTAIYNLAERKLNTRKVS